MAAGLGRLDDAFAVAEAYYFSRGFTVPDVRAMFFGGTYSVMEERRTHLLFEPVTKEQTGPDLFKPIVGRGSAFLDYDGDGDLDVVLVENNGPARLLRNDNKPANKWVRLVLEGDGEARS